MVDRYWKFMQQKNNFISAIVITYNEENNLKTCLDSIKWADEIIIVDSYSQDSTVQVAKQYTSKIYYKRFTNDFSEQRNFALQQVSLNSNWVFVIDADEYLVDDSGRIIKKLTESTTIDGFYFPRRNYITATKYLMHGYFYPDYQLRLFKQNKQIKYKGLVHEQPIISNEHTRIINNMVIYHNCSHSKYDSFLSIYRFFPYIRIEGVYKTSGEKNVLLLFVKGCNNIISHFYKSYIKKEGYKDGYAGFRAAFLHGFYLGMVSFYAAFIKLKS